MNRPFKCRLAAAMLVCPLLLTASCRPAEPSVSRPPPNASQAASAVPVSSQPVSSAPTTSLNPTSSTVASSTDTVSMGSLNLTFDKRVYVDNFNNDGYFTNKNEWIYWSSLEEGNAGVNTIINVGKYRNYVCKKSDPQWYKDYLASIPDDVIQGSYCWIGNYELVYPPYCLREDGTCFTSPQLFVQKTDEEKAYLQEVKSWRELLFIVDVPHGTIGLKKDGTIVFATPRPDIPSPIDPSKFHDIVMIGLSHYVGSDEGQYLCLLRKDGVLFNAKGEVLYENVVRLFPQNIRCFDSFALLLNGELISLLTGDSYGVLENPEDVITVQNIGPAVYALKKDGSFQTVWYDKADANQAEQAERMAQVTDCKTT